MDIKIIAIKVFSLLWSSYTKKNFVLEESNILDFEITENVTTKVMFSFEVKEKKYCIKMNLLKKMDWYVSEKTSVQIYESDELKETIVIN